MGFRIRCTRTIALAGAFAASLGTTPLAAQENQTEQSLLDPVRPLSAEIVTSIDDGFTFAAIGDCIISRPHSQMLETEPAFAAVMQIIREADVSFGNLETSLIDLRRFEGYPEAEDGGCWCIATPDTAQDLRDLGFDMFSRANNHALDWGRAGMRETSDWLDRAGLVHAGSGRTPCGSTRAAIPRDAEGAREPSIGGLYVRRVFRGRAATRRRARPARAQCTEDDPAHDRHRADDAVAAALA